MILIMKFLKKDPSFSSLKGSGTVGVLHFLRYSLTVEVNDGLPHDSLDADTNFAADRRSFAITV